MTDLDTYGLEELRMAQRQFHHLLDLSQLLTTSSNVVVANLIQCLLLFL